MQEGPLDVHLGGSEVHWGTSEGHRAPGVVTFSLRVLPSRTLSARDALAADVVSRGSERLAPALATRKLSIFGFVLRS